MPGGAHRSARNASQYYEAVPDAAPSYLLGSVDNCLRLLVLVVERGRVRVAEAAEDLGVVPSTAHRLLATLRHNGFVVQDHRGGAYSPGPRLTELGLAALGGMSITAAARPVLERLREELEETVSLVVLNGARACFLDSVEGTRPVRVSSRTGLVLPAHCASAGKALLAALSPEDLARRYPDRRLDYRTTRSINSWEQLEQELEEVRRTGWATNFEEGDTGISAVAACIHDTGGTAIAALAIAAPSFRISGRVEAERFAPVLLGAVAEIEQYLHKSSGAVACKLVYDEPGFVPTQVVYGAGAT